VVGGQAELADDHDGGEHDERHRRPSVAHARHEGGDHGPGSGDDPDRHHLAPRRAHRVRDDQHGHHGHRRAEDDEGLAVQARPIGVGAHGGSTTAATTVTVIQLFDAGLGGSRTWS
jgi:hypothetical protein